MSMAACLLHHDSDKWQRQLDAATNFFRRRSLRTVLALVLGCQTPTIGRWPETVTTTHRMAVAASMRWFFCFLIRHSGARFFGRRNVVIFWCNEKTVEQPRHSTSRSSFLHQASPTKIVPLRSRLMTSSRRARVLNHPRGTLSQQSTGRRLGALPTGTILAPSFGTAE